MIYGKTKNSSVTLLFLDAELGNCCDSFLNIEKFEEAEHTESYDRSLRECRKISINSYTQLDTP